MSPHATSAVLDSGFAPRSDRALYRHRASRSQSLAAACCCTGRRRCVALSYRVIGRDVRSPTCGYAALKLRKFEAARHMAVAARLFPGLTNFFYSQSIPPLVHAVIVCHHRAYHPSTIRSTEPPRCLPAASLFRRVFPPAGSVPSFSSWWARSGIAAGYYGAVRIVRCCPLAM